MDKTDLLRLKKVLNDPEVLELVYKRDFDGIYERLTKADITLRVSQAFTEICSKKNINPLDYTHCIPDGFLADSPIEEFKIPNHIINIKDLAFSHCTKLKNIIIPNSVTSIGAHAFLECKSLPEVTIPNSVTSMGWYTFMECYALKKVTISDNLENIPAGAFVCCFSLENVIIPNKVKSIGICAFQSCKSLTKVTIESSITSIEKFAFKDCTSLLDIKYLGTKDQFTAITKGINWKSEVPESCIIHCSDGDLKITEV